MTYNAHKPHLASGFIMLNSWCHSKSLRFVKCKRMYKKKSVPFNCCVLWRRLWTWGVMAWKISSDANLAAVFLVSTNYHLPKTSLHHRGSCVATITVLSFCLFRMGGTCCPMHFLSFDQTLAEHQTRTGKECWRYVSPSQGLHQSQILRLMLPLRGRNIFPTFLSRLCLMFWNKFFFLFWTYQH